MHQTTRKSIFATSFLSSMTGNREIVYRAIMQTTIQYHSMKFEIQSSNNEGGITSQIFDVWANSWFEMTGNRQIAQGGIDGHFSKIAQRSLITRLLRS